MKHVSARRLGVLVLGTTLALGTTLSPAQAATSASAGSAAAWLDGDLPAENYYSYTSFPGANTGLTIDAGLAGIAAGNASLVARTQAGVAATVGEYTSFETSFYGNSTAKALAFATRSGANPRSFGGRDLVAQMEALVRPDGRITDSDAATDPANDFTNAIGQAFAAEGLSAAGSPKAATVVTYLQGLQCASGAFGLDLPAAGAAPSCTDTSANPGADTTSLIGASVARLAPTAAVDSTIDRAATFLVATGQGGSYGGAAGSETEAPNSNSTGLAAALLGASCRVAAADQAADKVRALQLANGAVAYDEAGRAAGLDDETREQYRLSTTQAATGLIWDASATSPLTLAGPAEPVGQGSKQTLTITGAAQGETVCLTTPAGVQRLVGTGAALNVPVTAPTTGTATYGVTNGPGTTGYVLRAAGTRAQLKTKRVQVGGKVKVKVRNLVPGTRVVSKIRGTKVDTTKARANGVAVVTFRIKGKAAKAAQVGSIRRGQVDKVTLKMKPAGQKAVKKTLRITKR